MKDVKNQKENSFIEFVETTTSTINLDKEAQDEKLSKILASSTGYDESRSKDIVDNISNTIELIQDNFENLRKAIDEGKSRIEWLKGKIDQTIEDYKIDDPKKLISEIKEGLSKSNTQIGTELFGNKIDISKTLLNSTYDDINKTAIVNDFQEEIKNNTLLDAIISEKVSAKIDDIHKEIQAVKDYFNAKLDSPIDKPFKKAVSVAAVMAQEKDVLPEQLKDKTPDEIAAIVDKGVTGAKVAYKVANDEISSIDAVEYTTDRNVSILNSVVTKVCKIGGWLLGGKIGATIGSIFGPVGTVAGAAIGKVVGKIGGSKVSKFISEGVKKVASAAKSVFSAAWEGVKSVASSVWSTVTSFFGW